MADATYGGIVNRSMTPMGVEHRRRRMAGTVFIPVNRSMTPMYPAGRYLKLIARCSFP